MQRRLQRYAWLTLCTVLVMVCLACPAQANPRLELRRHAPCNLFEVGQPVRLFVQAREVPPGDGQATVELTDYFGKKTTLTVPVGLGDDRGFEIDLGTLDVGYYEIFVTLNMRDSSGGQVTADSQVVVNRLASTDGKRVHTTDPISFGVVAFTDRTAAQAVAEGSRFGLKLWQVGEPGVWWRRPLKWDVGEVVDATARLGLQWTRHIFNQGPDPEPGMISTLDLIQKHPMNVVFKIEKFPAECFDADRYGPREAWEKKHGKKWWERTVPAKEPYQRWLREQLAVLPPEQNVFEIANEPWGKISPEEFAEYCRLIVEVVREMRPDAIIGPNVGMGRFEWEKRFCAAGGFDGMNMVSIHPYSFTPLPEHRTRPAIRNYHDFLQAMIGRDLDLYVTEYGWPTAPNCSRGHSVSERVQAQRTTRQSLMLYAEDCKTLIPHWMGDREYDQTDREHWFGFFRLSMQPKPVLIAHAVCARMIDGSRFVGDLWYGPGVGAMLFERGGTYTLALWTLDEEPGAARDIALDVNASGVTIVDVMGRQRQVTPADGKLTLKINADVTYVVGVGAAMADRAVGPEGDLNPDRWTNRDRLVNAAHMTSEPNIDGNLDEWTNVRDVQFGKANARAMFGWDNENVYLAIDVPDDEVVSSTDRKGNPIGDAFELSIGARPDRQPSLGPWKVHEYLLQLSPGGSGATASLRLDGALFDKPLVVPAGADASGVRWAVRTTDGGYCIEVALPARVLGLSPLHAGQRIAALPKLFDKDGNKRQKYTVAEVDESYNWPYVVLHD